MISIINNKRIRNSKNDRVTTLALFASIETAYCNPG